MHMGYGSHDKENLSRLDMGNMDFKKLLQVDNTVIKNQALKKKGMKNILTHRLDQYSSYSILSSNISIKNDRNKNRHTIRK